MFFSISRSGDQRFLNHTVLGDWVISHDQGWTVHADSLTKGYRHDRIGHGNFLTIKHQPGCLVLDHDIDRAFPLWWNQDQQLLTNFLGTGQQIWTDQKVKLESDGIVLEHHDIIGQVDIADKAHRDQVCNAIVKNLVDKVKCLQTDLGQLTKKIYVSGGIDTVTLLALARSQNLPHQLVDFLHFEFDWFTNQHIRDLKHHNVMYGQIHHWLQPCVLLSGACGDEFLFRGPYSIAIWAAWHDFDIIEFLEKSQGYSKPFLLLENNRRVFSDHYRRRHEIKDRFPGEIDLNRHLIDVVANDHQHWHLGHTLTWTPFKDISLLKTMLSLGYDDLITQILDASISKDVIRRLHGDCLRLLSDHKNHNNRQYLHLL